MSTDANQIELLVREVLARIAQQTKTVAEASSTTPAGTNSGELELMSNVISAQSLEGKLKGITTVRVRQQAVVTPAARDLLRTAKVTLVRGAKSNSVASETETAQVRSAALLVLSPEKLVEVLKKQLCPRRALVALVDKNVDQIVMRLQASLSRGHRLGVVIAENSFELNMAINRVGIRSVRIGSWTDFQLALQEAAPDAWVLDPRHLNIPAIKNVCNRIYEDGYWRSRKENR
jgi:hypothetical protein